MNIIQGDIYLNVGWT